jgi:uncharacterized protein YjbI with pentapeptide repeats
MNNLREAIVGSAFQASPFRPPGTIIDVPLDLRAATVGHLDCRGLTFESFVDFSHARLQGLAWFDDAVFRSGVDFSHARFDRDARFDRAIFHAEALFVEAEFRGVADFDGATFERGCRMNGAVFFANASLAKASFRGTASLRDAELHGGIWCDGAAFETLDLANVQIIGRKSLTGAVAQTVNDPAIRFPEIAGRPYHRTER